MRTTIRGTAALLEDVLTELVQEVLEEGDAHGKELHGYGKKCNESQACWGSLKFCQGVKQPLAADTWLRGSCLPTGADGGATVHMRCIDT